MGNDQLSIIEGIVADKTIEKLGNFDAELIRLVSELFHRLRKTVGSLHIPASQCSDDLHVVIAWHTECLSRLHHA